MRTFIQQLAQLSSNKLTRAAMDQAVVATHLGLLHFNNTVAGSETKNVATPQEIFKIFSEHANNSLALFMEGMCLSYGFGTNLNLAAGEASIKYAAERHNDSAALTFLAMCTSNKNPKGAYHYLARAVENQDFNFAAKLKGDHDLYGKGTTQSYSAAIKSYKSAGPLGQDPLRAIVRKIDAARRGISDKKVHQLHLVRSQHTPKLKVGV